jgi:uncharacterized paraquat-inducible protein A
MVGEMEDNGLLNGLMKFASLGMYPKAFVVFGILKSVMQSQRLSGSGVRSRY